MKINEKMLKQTFETTKKIFLRHGQTTVSHYQLFQNIFVNQLIADFDFREMFNKYLIEAVNDYMEFRK